MQVGEILMMKTVWVCIDNWYSQKRVSFWKASRKYEFGNGEAQKRKSHHILINSTILFLHPLSKGRRTRLRLQQPNHLFGGQQSCLLKIMYTKSTHIIFRSGQLNLWSTRCQIPNQCLPLWHLWRSTLCSKSTLPRCLLGSRPPDWSRTTNQLLLVMS